MSLEIITRSWLNAVFALMLEIYQLTEAK
jgi:hypothetical protein